MSLYPGPVPVADVHAWKTEATQRLLGYTIAFTADAWHSPSLLPGWSRAHVATHLARNADYLASIVGAATAGRAQPEHPGPTATRHQLETGADRTGLEIQIDLDSASGALQQAFEAVTDWTSRVRIDGEDQPLSVVPLLRLHEVCLHSIDLDCGLEPDGIDPEAAGWLLRWALFRLRDAELPTIELRTQTATAVIGTLPTRLEVDGSDARVWAWLTGRVGPEQVLGADGYRPGLLG